MQRTIRVTAGASVVDILAPNGIDCEIGPGVHCVPCKRIRVVAASDGVVQLRLTWAQSSMDFNLWVGGHRFSRAGAITPLVVVDLTMLAGEQVVHVGSINLGNSGEGSYPQFTLSASTVK